MARPRPTTVASKGNRFIAVPLDFPVSSKDSSSRENGHLYGPQVPDSPPISVLLTWSRTVPRTGTYLGLEMNQLRNENDTSLLAEGLVQGGATIWCVSHRQAVAQCHGCQGRGSRGLCPSAACQGRDLIRDPRRISIGSPSTSCMNSSSQEKGGHYRARPPRRISHSGADLRSTGGRCRDSAESQAYRSGVGRTHTQVPRGLHFVSARWAFLQRDRRARRGLNQHGEEISGTGLAALSRAPRGIALS